MEDHSKSKARLIDELVTLRRSFDELETVYRSVEKEKQKYEEFLGNIDGYCFETDLAGNMIYCNEAA